MLWLGLQREDLEEAELRNLLVSPGKKEDAQHLVAQGWMVGPGVFGLKSDLDKSWWVSWQIYQLDRIWNHLGVGIPNVSMRDYLSLEWEDSTVGRSIL